MEIGMVIYGNFSLLGELEDEEILDEIFMATVLKKKI